jgi:hypothetical protein
MPSEGHIYEDEPDARQAGDIRPSRFRKRYRKLTEAEVAMHDAIKAKAAELEVLIEELGPGRYPALAMTSLENAVFWAVKALTS